MSRMLAIRCVITLSTITFGLAACDSGTEPNPTGQLILKEEVRVLSDRELNGILTITDDASTILFESAALDEELAVGDVLVAGTSNQAPHGFLRTIESIREEGPRVIVTTSQSALDDVFASGTVRFTLNLGPADVVEITALSPALNSVTPAPDIDSQSDSATLNLGFKLSSGLDVAGGINPDVDSEFELEFGSGGLKRADIAASLTMDGWFQIVAQAGVSGMVKADLLRVRFGTHRVFVPVGPVTIPIQVSPVATLSIGASGTMKAGFTAKTTVTATAGGGMEYRQGTRWTYTPLSSITMGGNANPLINGTVEFYLAANVEFELYGVGGPYLTPKLSQQIKSSGACVISEFTAVIESGISVRTPFRNTRVGAVFPEIHLYSDVQNGPFCGTSEYPSVSNLRLTRLVRNASEQQCPTFADSLGVLYEFEVDYRAGELDMWYDETRTGYIDFKVINEPYTPGNPSVPGGIIALSGEEFYSISQGTTDPDETWGLVGDARAGTVRAAFCGEDKNLIESNILVSATATDERNIADEGSTTSSTFSVGSGS